MLILWSSIDAYCPPSCKSVKLRNCESQSAMHKDPPPSLLERPPKIIITYGVLTGFVAGFVVFGAWSLFTAGSTPRLQQDPTAITDGVRR